MTPITPKANNESPTTQTRKRRRRAGRKGKIGRLPHAVREELNRRLWDGEAGGSLLAWLNGLPRAEARAITKQNLSEWRKGGWEDWLGRQESRERAGEWAEEMETMAGLDLGVLLQATRRMEDGPEKTRAVLQIVHEVVRLRTSDRTCERARRETGTEGRCGERVCDGAAGEERVHDAGYASGVVQGSPRKSGQIKVGEMESEGSLSAREGAEAATRGASRSTGSGQMAPRPQGEASGGDREKLGLADRGRAGAGMEDGPEEISSPVTRFPFAPMRSTL